jgi:hypothetical protein
MVFEDIRRCDEHDDVDFSDETELLKFVRKNRWVSVNVGSLRLIRINVRLFPFPYQNSHIPDFQKKRGPPPLPRVATAASANASPHLFHPQARKRAPPTARHLHRFWCTPDDAPPFTSHFLNMLNKTLTLTPLQKSPLFSPFTALHVCSHSG